MTNTPRETRPFILDTLGEHPTGVFMISPAGACVNVTTHATDPHDKFCVFTCTTRGHTHLHAATRAFGWCTVRILVGLSTIATHHALRKKSLREMLWYCTGTLLWRILANWNGANKF